jgi:hypothetical protein
MSLLEPPEPEEPTDATESLRDEIDWDSIMVEVPDYSTGDFNSVVLLSDGELVERFHEYTSELKRRGELINPTTDTGRDLHSQRGSIRIELSKRNLL